MFYRLDESFCAWPGFCGSSGKFIQVDIKSYAVECDHMGHGSSTEVDIKLTLTEVSHNVIHFFPSLCGISPEHQHETVNIYPTPVVFSCEHVPENSVDKVY